MNLRACVIACAALLPLKASALDLEPAFGVSEFCCITDSLWWQSPFGFTGNRRSLSYEFGVRKRIGNWGIAARYSELGEAAGQNIASMRDDEFGKYNTAQPCDTNQYKNCLAFFDVHQRVNAAMLGASYRFTFNGVSVEPEIGQAFYQSHMKVSILCPNCGVGSKYAFGAGGTFTSTSEIRRSPYAALRLTYKGATLTYRRISNIDGNGARTEGDDAQFASGLTHGPVNQLLIGVSL